MKQILFFILAALVSLTAYAQVDVCDSGSWSVPDIPEGLNVEVHEDAYYAYFYTHDGFDQAWLLLVGNPETGAGELFDTISDGVTATAHEIGKTRLWRDGSKLGFSWDIEFDFGRGDGGIPWCLSGCVGDVLLDRVTTTQYCE